MSALRPPSAPSLPELLAPAGSWDCARAAIENGADAIYFGLDRFNARMRADNFTTADLPQLMTELHQRGVKGYVTLNTLIFPNELEAATAYLRTIIAAGVDAAIVQDVGLCRLIRHLSPDFPIHGSTQMTITSAAGVAFAAELGCQLVVLARESSLHDLTKIQQQLADRQIAMPLEMFVHGALCVAYSGQCLTSEALGGRSANRGECAQACRMPYTLVADGQPVDLGDRQYLLSPQDLAGLPVLAEVVAQGVSCLKIEGRLKTPDYVANVTRVYRQALDRLRPADALAPQLATPDGLAARDSAGSVGSGEANPPDDRYRLEMAFSRGLHTGWFEGIDNQTLVHARFGKKRGVYLGEISHIAKDGVALATQAPVKPGDGVVFDGGNPAQREEGGRIYQVEQRGTLTWLRFGRRDVDLQRVRVGDKLWKTSDPALTKALGQTYGGDAPRCRRPLRLQVSGTLGQPLQVVATDERGHRTQTASTMALEAARSQPLTPDRLVQQLGRLGSTPFYLGELDAHALDEGLIVPVGELNRLRRTLVAEMLTLRSQGQPWQLNAAATLTDLLPSPTAPALAEPDLTVLVRNRPQLAAALAAGVSTLYCELENPAAYRDLVTWFRQQQQPHQALWVAPPRITKPRENYILDQVRRSEADGYLVRNPDHLAYFHGQRCIGDFSLNVANALTAEYFLTHYNLERVTASYDLNAHQLVDLLQSAPPALEVTLHQHMPMFHMEHCVFCAFLSAGKDFRDCGRPCETQTVHLEDRVGTRHRLVADAGCRNTLYNGMAQTGAEYAQRLAEAGARYFRLEFLDESPQQVERTITLYRQLLAGTLSGGDLWQRLKLQSKLGVTRGPLDS